jgi:arylsulfatase A
MRAPTLLLPFLLAVFAQDLVISDDDVSADASKTPPNFVVFVADDLGYYDLGIAGNPVIKTPNIDRLFSEGVQFTQFYGQPLCSPSRAAMFTGRMPVRGGVYTRTSFPQDVQFRVFYPMSQGCLVANETLVHQYLKNSGKNYYAGMVGKWHLGHQPDLGCLPTRRGFDNWIGIPYSHEEEFNQVPTNPPLPPAFPPIPYYHNETIVKQPVTLTDLPPLYLQQALADLDRLGKSKQPFFYHYSFDQPHFPVFASSAFQGTSARGPYGDAVNEIDNAVGAVLDRIRNNAHLKKNTIVFFASDNGGWVTPSGGFEGAPLYPLQGGSNGELYEQKGSTWEGGMRVVSAFWAHEQNHQIKLKPQRLTTVASMYDLVPTVLELAGIPLPTDRAFDGHSLVSALEGRNTTSQYEFFHYWREHDLYAIRKGPYKCHFQTRSGFGFEAPVVHNPCLLYQLEWNAAESVPLDPVANAGLIAEFNAEFTRVQAAVVKAPSQYELFNLTYVPCCQGPTNGVKMTQAQRAGLTGFAYWQFLGCVC